jgi:hypothetical protein
VTSSVSGKRSPAELIAPGRSWRWRRESNPCARLCRPLPHHSATPPSGLMPLHLRADDGIRTRDPHLGKVMRYQLRYIRMPRARSSPVAKHDISPPKRGHTNPSDATARRSEHPIRLAGDREAMPGLGVAARDTRFRAVTQHHPGRHRVAIIQWVAAAEGGVACTDERRLLARRQGDALAVVELTVRGPRRGRPVALGDVAADVRRVEDAADVAAGRREADAEDAVGSWPPQAATSTAPRPRRTRPARSVMAVTISPRRRRGGVVGIPGPADVRVNL